MQNLIISTAEAVRSKFNRVLALFVSLGLLTIPALAQHFDDHQIEPLIDAPQWAKESNEYLMRGSETLAYHKLVTIVYDWEIGRPWGEAYFPEAQNRLADFRDKVCTGYNLIGTQSKLPLICNYPLTVKNQSDVIALAESLKDAVSRKWLEQRWGLKIHSVILPNKPDSFNIIAFSSEATESGPVKFWDLKTQNVTMSTVFPLEMDVGSYYDGYKNINFPSQMYFSAKKIILNDLQLRFRALKFGNDWHQAIMRQNKSLQLNPIFDSIDIQFNQLYIESIDIFESVFQKTKLNKTASPTFDIKGNKNYPQEVFQHVAYQMLKEIMWIQGAYFSVSINQKPEMNSGHRALKALLTLQKYALSWRMFLLELQTRAAPLNSHAAVLDQMFNETLAGIYDSELIRAVLEEDVYSSYGLFDKMGYTIVSNSLFEEPYLSESKPRIYKELKSIGVDFKDLDQKSQIRLLKEYIHTQDGKIDRIALARIGAVFKVNITENDLRQLAQIIHDVRFL